MIYIIQEQRLIHGPIQNHFSLLSRIKRTNGYSWHIKLLDVWSHRVKLFKKAITRKN